MKTIQGSQALFLSLSLSLSLSLHSVYKEQAEHKSGQKKKINKKDSLVYLMDVIIHIGLSYLSLYHFIFLHWKRERGAILINLFP